MERLCPEADEGLFLKRHGEQRRIHEELREAYAIEIPMSFWLGELLSSVLGKGWADSILEEALDIMVEVRSSAAEAYPDCLPTLDELGEKGLKTAVITNISSGEVARRASERIGITQRVEFLVASEDIGLRKPHPAIFQHVARSLSVEPKKILHVGDSVKHDVRGAESAGMTPLFLARGRAIEGVGARAIRSLDQVSSVLGR